MDGELLDSSHVWILPHYQHPHWWEVEQYNRPPKHSHTYRPCSAEKMTEILSGVLFVDGLKYNVFQEDKGENQTDVYSLVSLGQRFFVMHGSCNSGYKLY